MGGKLKTNIFISNFCWPKVCTDLTYPLHLASWCPLLCWAHSWSAQPEPDAGPGHGGDTHTRHSLHILYRLLDTV